MQPNTPTTPFPHERLDAYRVALDLAVATKALSDRIPRGYRDLADQLLRCGTAPVLLVAEGANRTSAAMKRQRFTEARGECGEAAAAIELGLRLGFFPSADAAAASTLASRLAAMLTRLMVRWG